MNTMLLAAGSLAIFVGIVHSALGERLIFRKLREHGIVPTLTTGPLHESNVRILWATWHIASLFGWGIGIVLIRAASIGHTVPTWLIHPLAGAMLCSGLIVLFASRAKHPGWAGLCGVAILCWLA